MRLIKLKCPKCGSTFTAHEGSDLAICEYCGATVKVPYRKAKITIRRTKLNRKPFIIFTAVAMLLIVAATIILTTVLNSKKLPPLAFKADGVYLVGEDIPAGEYILYPNVKKSDGEVTPVLEVRKTKEAAADSKDFLYRREFYMRQYVNLNDGEYIAFEHALLYLPEKVRLKPLGKEGYAAAQLKVGEDIEAGEYVIVGENKKLYYFITSKPEAALYGTAALNSPDMLDFDYCENRIYLKVKSGQYLSFLGGKLYKVGDAPKPVKSDGGILPPGQYKAGVDIQSGRYKVTATENHINSATVCINKNAVKTGELSSWDIQHNYVGGETLDFIRLSNSGGEAEIDIPDIEGADIYVTFNYCTVEALNR